jgi:uncharacterized membrane protein
MNKIEDGAIPSQFFWYFHCFILFILSFYILSPLSSRSKHMQKKSKKKQKMNAMKKNIVYRDVVNTQNSRHDIDTFLVRHFR